MPNPHKDTIIAMRKSGKWPSEIWRELGISRNAVIGICNRAGLCSSETDSSEPRRLFAKRGEQQKKAKLSDAAVAAARAAYKPWSKDANYTVLAEQHGVSMTVMRAAIIGKTWAHVQ